jgi:hypothetical protein
VVRQIILKVNLTLFIEVLWNDINVKGVEVYDTVFAEEVAGVVGMGSEVGLQAEVLEFIEVQLQQFLSGKSMLVRGYISGVLLHYKV